MNKFQELLDKYDLSMFVLSKDTGQASRQHSMENVISGEREITSLNLNLLTSFARSLGVRLEDILNDYDLDGSTSQVLNLKRLVNRIGNIKKGKKETISNGSFVVTNNPDIKLAGIDYKKDYEFLNPKLEHNKQPTNDIYLLNNMFRNSGKGERNKTLTNFDRRFNYVSDCFFIYSPLKTGGDLKVIVNVHNKNGDFKFAELFGCEWIDTDNNKTLCYYRGYNSEEDINLNNINSIDKEEVSEIAFYRALYSQFPKFNISP